ncbi:aldehyde dehydrogenase family protein [Streptomyces sp. NPDC059853]|uniref:aldehyde dehydrogenase family protein n=1 Tax=Streptomyces sp. NPDC059853 TaxID=3346973 RepID=UPI0036574D1A
MFLFRRLLVPDGTTWETDQIITRVRSEADSLARRGIGPGSRVMLSGPNTPEWVVALLALAHLDASVVLCDHRATAAHRASVRDRARVVLEIDGASAPPGAVPEPGGPPGGIPDLTAWSRRRDAVISWSSGTTGAPKGIVRSGRSILDNLALSAERMGYRTDDVLLPVLPYSHQYGLSLVLCWWLRGGTLVVYGPAARLDRALEAGAAHGLSIVDATPPTYHSLLSLFDSRPALRDTLSGVRAWCVGGAPLGRSLAERFAAVTGRPLLDGYGATEVGNIALAPPSDPVRCGTPLPGVVVEVHDEAGRPLPPGQLGELVVRSPGLMTGHLGEDGGIVPVPGPVHRTGDIGLIDAAGRVAPIGRKRAVHRDGHTLYPDHLAELAEAAGAPTQVVALADERRGVRLVFVVADPRGRDRAHWKRAFRAVLARYERPDDVLVVREFPLNSTGKPDPAALESLAMTLPPTSAGPAGDETPASRTAPETIPFPERLEALRAVRRWVHDHRDAVLEILTEVSPHRTAVSELEAFLATLDGAEEEIRHFRPGRVPRAAVFMPSNIPLYAYALYLLVASLYTDTVSFRPSSQIGSQARRLHALLAPVHGLPIELSDLSQRTFVSGPVREADLIVFTGSYANAETVREELTADQLFLFFGQGLNPFVVAPDADLDHAVRDLVTIRLYNSGQDCYGPDVVFVPEQRSRAFTDLLSARLSALRYGPNTDPGSDYGPMYYDAALAQCSEYLLRHADRIRQGGRIDLRTRRVEPTVLTWDFEDRMPLEEMFAPVFNVVTYPDEARLCERLSSPYFGERALGAMVYGTAPQAVEVLSRRHRVCVDQTLLDAENGNRPFGGLGMMANYLSVGGRRRSEPLLMSKTAAEYLPSAGPVAAGRP